MVEVWYGGNRLVCCNVVIFSSRDTFEMDHHNYTCTKNGMAEIGWCVGMLEYSHSFEMDQQNSTCWYKTWDINKPIKPTCLLAT